GAVTTMSSGADRGGDALFLPDFCGIRAVFGVVVLAELLAFVIALVQAGGRTSLLDELAAVSLFVQWVALSCAGLLCLARPWLTRLGELPAAAIAYAGILLVTWIVSELAWWVLARAGGASGGLRAEAHGEF